MCGEPLISVKAAAEIAQGLPKIEPHCKPGQVEPAYIECGNGAAAMQVSQVNLFGIA